MAFRFSIPGPPRTKKTSSRIVTIPGKKDAEGNRGKGFTKILPSEAFEDWLEAAVLQGARIRMELQQQGARLPFRIPVALRMLFYRDRETGDLNGFEQAVCDALQIPLYRFPCADCKKATIAEGPPATCTGCKKKLHQGKQHRKGIGIIADDVLVRSKDGSRLLKDSARPRVDIEISEFLEEPVQAEGLFDSIEPEPEPLLIPVAVMPKKANAPQKSFSPPETGLLKPGDLDY